VLTTPALQLLQEYRPDLRIAVVVEDRFREIFGGEMLAPSASAVRAFRPSLCLNFHGGTRSAAITALSGARFRAGFAHYRRRFVYNVVIPSAQQVLSVDRKVHTAEHLASAMFYLGVPQKEIPRARIGNPGPAEQARGPALRCIIHPVAASSEKTWPAERFLEVARHLAQSGIEPVFIGSAADDLTMFSSYRTVLGSSLTAVTSELASASLFIGNDSGPAHMAAACGLPTVVLFGPSDPEIWGPWRTSGEVVRDPAGLAAVPASRVIEALHRLRVPA
jgi:ADP-heptose:LPS heptosyltransferase